MILFEKGMEIADDVLAKINDPLGLTQNPEYIEKELLNYVKARADSGFFLEKKVTAEEEVKDFVKDGDIKKVDDGKGAAEIGGLEVKLMIKQD